MPGSTTIRVHMLDDTTSAYEVKLSSYGNVLLQALMKDLDILESDYFGAYFDNGDGLTFLDPLRQIGRQIKSVNDMFLEFGVKFFTPDPSQMQEEYTRYLFALQVKRDINNGTLPCAENTALEIASYIVQAEFGDWNATECSDISYLNDIKIFPNPTPEQLHKISDLHKNLVGKKPADADYSLLDIARRLEFYGVRLYTALDAQNVEIRLGICHAGILVFQGTKKINNFNWSRIRKLSFKRKRFLIKLRTDPKQPGGQQRYGDILVFVMKSRDASKNFWRLCIEHHAFFRLEVKPKVKPKPILLSRGSSFHYNGKTQKELLELVRNTNYRRSNFVRTTSRRRMHNSTSSHTDASDLKNARPGLNLQDTTINQSNNATAGSSVTSPSVASSVTDQGSYRVDDSTRSVVTEPSTTAADITPDSGQKSPMPEWQLESKSLHSSATPIEETEPRQEQTEERGKADLTEFKNFTRVNDDSKTDETDLKTASKARDLSHSKKMRLAFENSRKNDRNVNEVAILLQNVASNNTENTTSNVNDSRGFHMFGKSLSFDPLSFSTSDEFIPPLPPKERQFSNEGSYDNLNELGDSKGKVISSGEHVSSSGFRGMGEYKNDPFVNDSVVNLATVAVPMTPEVKVRIGEQKIKTGHYSVPKKPPTPPDGQSFNSPRWNRTSLILDKEINEAMTQLYKAINESSGNNERDRQILVDSDLPVVVSSSDDEKDFDFNAESEQRTPVSPEDDPLLAPIKMEFDDADTLVSSI